MSLIIEIGQQISATMKRKNVTLSELSRRTKLTEEQLDQIIHAKVDVSLDTLTRITSALGVNFIISKLA